jgi:hypothetical protein
VTRTEQDPTPVVVLTDTNVPAPAATQRTFRKATTTLEGGNVTGNPAPVAINYECDLPAGSHTDINVLTRNADAPAGVASANVTLTVVDQIETPTVARKVQTDVPGQTRIHPNYLPREWQDPTIATPGLPTATRLRNARRYGSIIS